MDLSSADNKLSVKPYAVSVCDESCSGFQSHSWRKSCETCGGSAAGHAPGGDLEDDQRMGRLLADSPCAHLTVKVKGGGGLRLYKRNRMIVTNPVVTRKDPTFSTTTYEWAPGGVSQRLAVQYMELLPESRRPVSGTVGASERRRQLLDQLPPQDLDPIRCQGLSSQDEVSSMLLFVRSYKQEVLGVGEVALPGEGGALREAANQRRAREAKDKKEAPEQQDYNNGADSSSDGSTNGTRRDTHTGQVCCSGCRGDMAADSPAVFAERAGYGGALWHPACFTCSQCAQGLVDLVYFWANQRLYCGRHYCQGVWPRCSGCDELIFSKCFHTAADGRTWHHAHV